MYDDEGSKMGRRREEEAKEQEIWKIKQFQFSGNAS
jgi:hypothetical protein